MYTHYIYRTFHWDSTYQFWSAIHVNFSFPKTFHSNLYASFTYFETIQKFRKVTMWNCTELQLIAIKGIHQCQPFTSNNSAMPQIRQGDMTWVYIWCLVKFPICYAVCKAVNGHNCFTLFTSQRGKETWSNEYVIQNLTCFNKLKE